MPRAHAEMPLGVPYLDLVRRFPLRPIRSDDELDRAVAVVDELVDKGELSPDESDYLEVLGGLIERYESEHHPMPPVSDAEMLRFLIDQRGVTQQEVTEATGIAESTVSEIHKGRRGLNRKHIEALARYFAVSPSVFFGD